MKIIFLGTRGYLKIKSKRHNKHTSTLIINNNKKVMIDCGLDWSKKVYKIKPDAIVITHAHPDHSWGLKEGSPCPVFATSQSWEIMKKFKINDNQKNIIHPEVKTNIFGIIFEAFSVVHSIRAPAVGYRISVNKKTFFYSGDLIYINNKKQALADCLLYIADGATINRPMVRKKDDQLFGHTTISTQLTWCQKENIPWAIITHCGTQIVKNDGRTINAKIQTLAKKKGIKVQIAYDGMEIKI